MAATREQINFASFAERVLDPLQETRLSGTATRTDAFMAGTCLVSALELTHRCVVDGYFSRQLAQSWLSRNSLSISPLSFGPISEAGSAFTDVNDGVQLSRSTLSMTIDLDRKPRLSFLESGRVQDQRDLARFVHAYEAIFRSAPFMTFCANSNFAADKDWNELMSRAMGNIVRFERQLSETLYLDRELSDILTPSWLLLGPLHLKDLNDQVIEIIFGGPSDTVIELQSRISYIGDSASELAEQVEREARGLDLHLSDDKLALLMTLSRPGIQFPVSLTYGINSLEQRTEAKYETGRGLGRLLALPYSGTEAARERAPEILSVSRRANRLLRAQAFNEVGLTPTQLPPAEATEDINRWRG